MRRRKAAALIWQRPYRPPLSRGRLNQSRGAPWQRPGRPPLRRGHTHDLVYDRRGQIPRQAGSQTKGDAAQQLQGSNLQSQEEHTTAEAAAPTDQGEPTQGERTTTVAAVPSATGETAQGEPAEGERTPAVAAASAAQGEPPQGEPTTERDLWMAMPAKYSKKFRKAAGILKHIVKPHEEWHIDWAIMGQETLGLDGEGYTLAVLDVGSNLGTVINTRTREDPWEKLRELAALWGHAPKAIRGDGAKEFFHAKGFKAWCAKEKIVFHPVEPYRHTMQGYIENLVKQIKVHSRTGLSDAEIEALHKTKIRQPTRVSARVQEAQNPPREVAKGNEQALDPATHADATDLILEATDKALATFSAKRNLVLDLHKDAFFDRAPQVKYVDMSVRNGRVYITL